MTQTGGRQRPGPKVAPEWKHEAVWLGQELRRWRMRAGLNQRQLAALVPMNHSYLHKLETGAASQPSARYWLPLALRAAADERARFKAAVQISALEARVRERAEDLVARHVSQKMGMAR